MFWLFRNWPDWKVSIIFRFFPMMFEMTTEKVFHADDKFILRLLNVVIHADQFKRKPGKYCKFHFDKEAYTKPRKHQDLYVLNWKSSYDVMLLTCQNRQHFVWFLGPGICKNTICYSRSSQEIRVYIPCLFSISPEPISNARMFIYFVYCILIIVYLLQGSVMEQPVIKHRPRLSMT